MADYTKQHLHNTTHKNSIEIVAVLTGPGEVLMRQNSRIEKRKWTQGTTPNKKLFAVDAYWERDVRFVFFCLFVCF